MLNRAALEAVGGFAYGSVTEDFLTSLTLQSAGYRTRYVDEVMAEGLAPSSMGPFFAQRLRWAVGGLQIFWRFNPLWGGAFRGGKLTVEQRLLYTWSGGHYLLCFPLAVVLCTPFIFLLDGGGLLLTTGALALGRGGGGMHDVLIPKLNPTNPTSLPSPPHHTTQAPSASTCSTLAPTTSSTRSSPSSRTPASAGARASGTCGARSRSRSTSSSHSSAPPSSWPWASRCVRVCVRSCLDRGLLTDSASHIHPIPQPPTPQFGFQVTRKDPAAPRSPHLYRSLHEKQKEKEKERQHDRSRQKQQRQQQQQAEAEAAAMADLAVAMPHALLLFVGWACLLTGALQLMALPSGDQGGLRVAYGINMAWAALVLSGLWAPVGQVLDLGVPCWFLDAPGAWVRGAVRRVALRAGYVPIAELEEAVAVAAAAGGMGKGVGAVADVEAGLEEGKREASVVVAAGKAPRPFAGAAVARGASPPPLSPPAVQPGRREEGNNELWRKRQGIPPAAVEEGTPLLRGGFGQ